MQARTDFYTASPDAMKAMLALEAAVGKLSIELPLLLPLPTDKRLAPLLQNLDALPPELQALQRQVAASGKTIGRIFLRETGMGYQQWRQQWRLMRAIELLATGRSLGYCAFELGFASDSALIAFFKAMTGATPRGYFK